MSRVGAVWRRLRWPNQALLALIALTVVALVAHVVAAWVDSASKGPDCWECPFPGVAHRMSAAYLAAGLVLWAPFVFWYGTLASPGYARLLAVPQVVAAVAIAVLAAPLAWPPGILPLWAWLLNYLWLLGAAAHGVAVLLVRWPPRGELARA